MDETMINALLASAADAGLFWAGQRLSRIAQLDQRTALPDHMDWNVSADRT